MAAEFNSGLTPRKALDISREPVGRKGVEFGLGLTTAANVDPVNLLDLSWSAVFDKRVLALFGFLLTSNAFLPQREEIGVHFCFGAEGFLTFVFVTLLLLAGRVGLCFPSCDKGWASVPKAAPLGFASNAGVLCWRLLFGRRFLERGFILAFRSFCDNFR